MTAGSESAYHVRHIRMVDGADVRKRNLHAEAPAKPPTIVEDRHQARELVGHPHRVAAVGAHAVQLLILSWTGPTAAADAKQLPDRVEEEQLARGPVANHETLAGQAHNAGDPSELDGRPALSNLQRRSGAQPPLHRLLRTNTQKRG